MFSKAATKTAAYSFSKPVLRYFSASTSASKADVPAGSGRSKSITTSPCASTMMMRSTVFDSRPSASYALYRMAYTPGKTPPAGSSRSSSVTEGDKMTVSTGTTTSPLTSLTATAPHSSPLSSGSIVAQKRKFASSVSLYLSRTTASPTRRTTGGLSSSPVPRNFSRWSHSRSEQVRSSSQKNWPFLQGSTMLMVRKTSAERLMSEGSV
mmetsp:Transcript_36429/g.93108  ORF Transcript_36429/g.93108 Transcript_36429/m.93108 type:complete len:209 (+) Transcript_36429:58-684(+)